MTLNLEVRDQILEKAKATTVMATAVMETSSSELITGRLEPYFEQGWEGRFDYTFMPAKDPHLINDGRGYFLENGDFLKILDLKEEVLWEGEIQWIASRLNVLFFRDRHRLDNNVWSTVKQKGVTYADWVGWFWSTPRLVARFRRRNS